MWELTVFKELQNQQDIKVRMIVKEMAANSYATFAEAFENHFKDRLQEVPRTNNFSAELLYKVKHLNTKSVEIWKLTVTGDLKCKVFRLDFIYD